VVAIVRESYRIGPLTIRLVGTPISDFIDVADVRLAPGNEGEGALRRLLHEVGRRDRWDLARFNRVPRRSHLVNVLGTSAMRYALTDSGAAAYCDVTSPAALAKLSRQNYRNVNRLEKRAASTIGPVTATFVADESVSTTAYDRFVGIESAGWKGTEGTGLGADLRAQRFFREVLRRFQPAGDARLNFLSIGGQDAAAQLAVRSSRTWYILKIGFTPEFRASGPGNILLKWFLDEAAADPAADEVSLTTNPPWAARWHFQTDPCYDVLIFAESWRGRALAASSTGKELARAVRDRLLPRRLLGAT
jgi:CelD/BcsL family acetyltransferase involved in cellulose biosynthesis